MPIDFQQLIDCLREIDHLRQEVNQLFQSGQYNAALPNAQKVCELCRQYLGEEHANYASALNNLASLYSVMGDYAIAEPIYCHALEIRRKILGEEHPDYATSLNNLARLYHDMSNYMAAEPLYRQACEIRRKVFGEQHLKYANSINNLAGLYQDIAHYAAAELLFHQACEIRRNALGEQHPDYANSLNNLAGLYYCIGNYATAEPLYRQANSILQKVLGEEHPYYAIGLNNLAHLCSTMGKYEEAKELYCRSTEIRHKVFGEDHPEYASSLANIGGLYCDMGNYAAAKPLYYQSRDIWRKVFGEEHREYARSLVMIARLYEAMGNYLAAEPLFRQASEIRRKILGDKHPVYAASLGDLGLLYQAVGNYASAESLYQEASIILRTSLGDHHPEYAACLNNLAMIYQNTGNYIAAEQLYCQAQEIRRTALGEYHSDYAASLHNLASLYYGMGDYSASESFLRQAKDIWYKTLGEYHPNFAICISSLAVLLVAMNKINEGMKLIQEAGKIEDNLISQIFSISTEPQRMVYVSFMQKRMQIGLSLVIQRLSQSSVAIQSALDEILRHKAINTEASNTLRQSVLSGRYPQLVTKLHALDLLKNQIGQKTLAGPGLEDPLVYQKRLTEWRTQAEQLEDELIGKIPEMNLEQQLRRANRQEIAQALPAQSVLVEFVRCDTFNFKAVPARGEVQWQPAHYLAFVLPAGVPDQVALVDLGEAEVIDRMVIAFRAGVTGAMSSHDQTPATPVDSPADQVNKRDAQRKQAIHLIPEPTAPPPVEGFALRSALFDPLCAALGECKRLFLAPDGDLTRLPFETLPTDDGHFLIDDYEISYLSTGRDLLRFAVTGRTQPMQPLVAADPDFDFSLDTREKAVVIAAQPLIGRQSRVLDRGALHFRRLPGTQIEGKRIAALLGVEPLMQADVLEAHLKASRSPQILHIATHGFFLPNQQRDPNAEYHHFGMIDDHLSRIATLENPLLRAGLALAGANTWCQAGELPAEAEDAILNGEDVAGLDLLDTELVVLSACETGLGEVQVGEGVFGLRRSFVLAGAKTLVMSLWKVPDQQTQVLMEEFYRRILAGEPRADALCNAQLALKMHYPHPFYWGAFICQGNPGPLAQPSKLANRPVVTA